MSAVGLFLLLTPVVLAAPAEYYCAAAAGAA